MQGAVTIDGQLQNQSQLIAARDLTLATRTGALIVDGWWGNGGNPSAKTVTLNQAGSITLQGASVETRAANLSAGKDIQITSFAGNVLIDGVHNRFASMNSAKQQTRLTQEINEIDWMLNRKTIRTGQTLTQPEITSLTAEKTELERYRTLLNRPTYGAETIGSVLNAANNVNLISANAMSIHGAKITATEHINIQTSGWLSGNPNATDPELRKSTGLSIAALMDTYRWGDMNTANYGYAIINNPTELLAGGTIKLQTMGDVTHSRMVLNSSEFRAGGHIDVQAVSDIRLESGEEEIFDTSTRSYKTGKWYKRKTVSETSNFKDHDPAPDLFRSGSLSIKGGKGIDAYATQFLTPTGNISLIAADALSLYAVNSVSYDKVDKEVKKSFLGIRYDKTTTSTSRDLSQPLPVRLVAQNVSTQSGWNTTLQGTIFQTSLSGANVQAGVGPNARADAQILLQGIKSTVTQQSTRDSNYVVWQKQTHIGTKVETLSLPQFIGPSAPTLSAPGGIVADVPYTQFTSTVVNNSKVSTVTSVVGQPGSLSITPPLRPM